MAEKPSWGELSDPVVAPAATPAAANAAPKTEAAAAAVPAAEEKKEDAAVAAVTASVAAVAVTTPPAAATSDAAAAAVAAALSAPAAVAAAEPAAAAAVAAPAEEQRPAMGIGLHKNDEKAEIKVIGEGIYSSASTFEDLNLSPNLLRGVSGMNWSRPSAIQGKALPIILSKKRHNMIAQAHHGSGKTGAYSLALLSSVDEQAAGNPVQAVCVCPTRELALQVSTVIEKIGQYTAVKVYRGVPAAAGEKRPPPQGQQIIVGTSGTLKNVLRKVNVKSVRMMVLDEADQMVDKYAGQGNDAIAIQKMLPKSCQIVLFSATFSAKCLTFAQKMAPKATQIILKQEELSLDGIKQFQILCATEDEKYQLLTAMYSLLDVGQSIIFVQTRAMAKSLCAKMRADDYTVSLLYGTEMKVEERDSVMKDFADGKTSVLICTNVISRGIDVLGVTVVVNYEVPLTRDKKPDRETYMHRIGRSGRFGRKGVAVNMLRSPQDVADLKDIVDHYQIEMHSLSNDLEQIEAAVSEALK